MLQCGSIELHVSDGSILETDKMYLWVELELHPGARWSLDLFGVVFQGASTRVGDLHDLDQD